MECSVPGILCCAVRDAPDRKFGVNNGQPIECLSVSKQAIMFFHHRCLLCSAHVVPVWWEQDGAELDAFIAENSDVVSAASDGLEVSFLFLFLALAYMLTKLKASCTILFFVATVQYVVIMSSSVFDIERQYTGIARRSIVKCTCRIVGEGTACSIRELPFVRWRFLFGALLKLFVKGWRFEEFCTPHGFNHLVSLRDIDVYLNY